jgi:hypothetical protein
MSGKGPAMKPICVHCERFMRPKRNGIYFLEGKPWGGDVEWNQKHGKDATGWTPYKLWAGDLWMCPTCGTQIIVGVPATPIAEHYQPEFAAAVARTGADRLLVKDC